jgi:rhodanese-related sulfurtransferase
MVETITAQQMAVLIGTGDFDLVDVRDESEWAAGHIPGTRALTIEALRADPDTALPRKDGIIFVCAKGMRSLTAAKLADRLGYTTVYSLDGGTNAWAKAGYEIVIERTAAAAAA